MSKTQTILYSIAFVLIFICAPAAAEGYPMHAFGMIAVAFICVRIAEKGVKKRGRR